MPQIEDFGYRLYHHFDDYIILVGTEQNKGGDLLEPERV